METAKLIEIVEDYYTDLLCEDEKSRYLRDPVEWSGETDTVTGLEIYESDCREMLANGKYSIIEEDLQRYVNKHKKFTHNIV